MTNMTDITNARVYLEEPTTVLTDGTVMSETTLDGIIYFYFREHHKFDMQKASNYTTAYIRKLGQMFDAKEYA